MISIVGFTGKMGVGKSTAVSYLKNAKDAVKPVRFAGVLYELQGMIYDRIKDVHRAPNPLKDRKLLQWLGTEWGRSISPTLWIDLWRQEVFKYQANGFIILAEDVRFDNEAEAIRGLGGKVIEITASTIDDRDVVTNGIAGHASEAGVNRALIDYSISNDGSLDQLKAKLDNMWKELRNE